MLAQGRLPEIGEDVVQAIQRHRRRGDFKSDCLPVVPVIDDEQTVGRRHLLPLERRAWRSSTVSDDINRISNRTGVRISLAESLADPPRISSQISAPFPSSAAGTRGSRGEGRRAIPLATSAPTLRNSYARQGKSLGARHRESFIQKPWLANRRACLRGDGPPGSITPSTSPLLDPNSCRSTVPLPVFFVNRAMTCVRRREHSVTRSNRQRLRSSAVAMGQIVPDMTP